MRTHAPGSLGQRNLIYQNMVMPEYRFFVLLTSQFLYAIDLYVDQLFQQLLHPILVLTLTHHALLGVEVQNLGLMI